MPGNRIALVLPAFALLLLLPGLSFARQPAPVSAPLEQSRASQQRILELLNEMEQLQREVQQLRGEVELQSHTIEQMRRQQRQQYLDVDQRLNNLNAGDSVSAPQQYSDPAQERLPIEAPPLPVKSLPPARVQTPVHNKVPISISTAAPTSTQGIENNGDQPAYNQAFGLLKDGKYAPAAEEFRQFISTYPASTYADNAQYWLAETYYKTRQHKQALEEFSVVLEKYPGSRKALDARLKIGYIHYELQNWKFARQELGEVIRLSPNSTASRLAQNRLKRMRSEGH